MPSLKDLHCFIGLPNGKNQLREFGTTYGDGCVETFVAVPERPQPFSIRLSSSKFIAPGLAMYVFIDGVYQCNRNRQNLKLRKPPDRKSLVEFVVRQKEERQDDGTMIARDWNFERLDIVSASEAPDACSSKVLDNIGCIEVVVLRCAGMRSAKSAVKPMNLDGAGDTSDHPFGFDGAPNSHVPNYDDRSWEYIRGGSKYGAPTTSTSHLQSGPPPPLSSHSYTTRQRYNSPALQQSPQPQEVRRAPENLAGIVRYGSGPVPHQTRTASMHAPAPSIQGASAAHMPIDPHSLDHALMNMAKRSSDRYYQITSPSPTIPTGAPNAPPSHVPGSWPSPHGPLPSQLVGSVQDLEIGPILPPPAAALGLQSLPPDTYTNWDQCFPKPSAGWNEGNGWDSGEEEKKPSIWGGGDGGDAWSSPHMPQQGNGRSAFKSGRAPEHAPTAWDAHATHDPSSITRIARTGRWTQSSDFITARSRPSASGWGSEIDGEGWTHIGTNSDSSGSWFLPVHPSESISHVAGPSVVASATSQAPFVNELSSKLHSLKKDEETCTHPVDTASIRKRFPATQFHGAGWSTFEKSVRNAPVNSNAKSVWTVEPSEVAPRPWAAMEKDIFFRDLVDKSLPIENRHGDKDTVAFDKKVRNNEGWMPYMKATRDSGWSAKETTAPRGGRSFVLKENGLTPKDDRIIEELPGDAVEETSWNLRSKPKNTQATDTSWQADINGWSVPQKTTSLANGSDPWKATAETKAQPSKTRLSKYRQLRFPVTEIAAKGHWQFLPPALEHRPKAVSEINGMKAEPLLKFVKEDAAKKGVEHQVRAGKGSKYGHAIGRPEYLDSLEKPYAVFRYKYRAHGTLRKTLGKDVVPSNAALLATSPVDPLHLARPVTSVEVIDVKQQLKKVPKDALIDGLLDLQLKLEKETKLREVAPVETAGTNRTRDWVKQQSRETSVHGNTKDNQKGSGSWSEDDGWN